MPTFSFCFVLSSSTQERFDGGRQGAPAASVGCGGPHSLLPLRTTDPPLSTHIIEPERSTTRQMSRSSCVDVATCSGSKFVDAQHAGEHQFHRAAERAVGPPAGDAHGVRLGGCPAKCESRRGVGLRRRADLNVVVGQLQAGAGDFVAERRLLGALPGGRSICARLSSFAPARAAASVAVRSSVRTSCIQATSTANAAMMMHSGKQTAINTSIAARRFSRRLA